MTNSETSKQFEPENGRLNLIPVPEGWNLRSLETIPLESCLQRQFPIYETEELAAHVSMLTALVENMMARISRLEAILIGLPQATRGKL